MSSLHLATNDSVRSCVRAFSLPAHQRLCVYAHTCLLCVCPPFRILPCVFLYEHAFFRFVSVCLFRASRFFICVWLHVHVGACLRVSATCVCVVCMRVLATYHDVCLYMLPHSHLRDASYSLSPLCLDTFYVVLWVHVPIFSLVSRMFYGHMCVCVCLPLYVCLFSISSGTEIPPRRSVTGITAFSPIGLPVFAITTSMMCASSRSMTILERISSQTPVCMTQQIKQSWIGRCRR